MKETLEKRESLYGGFNNVAKVSQELKKVMRPALENSDDVIREAIEMICHKMARIAASEKGWKVVDNFHDIAGYATLAENHLLNNVEGAVKTVVGYEKTT